MFAVGHLIPVGEPSSAAPRMSPAPTGKTLLLNIDVVLLWSVLGDLDLGPAIGDISLRAHPGFPARQGGQAIPARFRWWKDAVLRAACITMKDARLPRVVHPVRVLRGSAPGLILTNAAAGSNRKPVWAI